MENVWQRPLQNESLAKQVYQKLKDAIFSGELAPGNPIREMHVARSMQVSQATVREALVQLQQTGLVVREPNRRTIVSSFTRDEIRDRIAVRLALEQVAAVEAAQRLSPAEFEQLASLADAIDRTIDVQNSLETVRADIEFHSFIWRHCGNAILAHTLELTTTPLFGFMSTLIRAGMVDLETTRPHTRIQQAMLSKDPASIHHELQAHMDASYQGFLKSGLPSLNALALTGD